VVPYLQKVTTTSREFHQVHVQPKVDQVGHESTRLIHTTKSYFLRTMAQTHQKMVEYRPWYWNTAPNNIMCFDAAAVAAAADVGDNDHPIPPPWYVILQEGTCRSFGQVIFCNNPVSGSLIWLAMLLASPWTAICSVICVIMVRNKTKQTPKKPLPFFLYCTLSQFHSFFPYFSPRPT
jgi:Urea transporter